MKRQVYFSFQVTQRKLNFISGISIVFMSVSLLNYQKNYPRKAIAMIDVEIDC